MQRLKSTTAPPANRKHVLSAAWLCVLATLASTALQAGPQYDTSLPRLHLPFKQAKLENGLRVITIEDHRTPIVSVVQVFNVGSANEQPGRTGFAHLFEHLMFQGSANVGPGQHIKLIENYGGFSNATTGTDFTAYFDSVPANQLDFALFLNGDRLRSLQISAGNLAKEKEVVKEELRLRFENQPYRKGMFVLDELLYDSFAYRHKGVGTTEDLDAASLPDVRQFFNAYYTAANLILVIHGDFDGKTILTKVKRAFGDLPARPAPARPDVRESRQTAERRRTIEDPFAPLVNLNIAFKAVPGDDPDFFALTVLSSVLQEGHSSRLYRALVDGGLASNVGGRMAERRGPGAFYVEATLRPATQVDAVEQAIYSEIARLQEEPVAAWELEKARTSLAASYLDGLGRGLLRAFAVGQYTAEFDDPNRINTYIDRIAAVTAGDVQRVAREHLRAENRSVLVTLPMQAAEGTK